MRPPRYEIIWKDCIFHVTWQCHNKDWLLAGDGAKRLYYELLCKYKDKYKIVFYSYCFMSNHPHLTGKIDGSIEAFSAFFRVVNSLFAKQINKENKRKGQVVMDRFKSPVIQTDEAHMEVIVYGDLNPQRANMIKHPREYPWSSYAFYAFGKTDRLLTPAPCYFALGNTDQERQERYQRYVNMVLKRDHLKQRYYSHTYFIGNPAWVLEKVLSLHEVMKIKRESYLKRQQRFFQELHAPP